MRTMNNSDTLKVRGGWGYVVDRRQWYKRRSVWVIEERQSQEQNKVRKGKGEEIGKQGSDGGGEINRLQKWKRKGGKNGKKTLRIQWESIPKNLVSLAGGEG